MPGSSGWKVSLGPDMDLNASARSGATLAVLAVIFLGGVTWAWSQVTDPFPEKIEQPDCIETLIPAGEDVTPGDLVVSVLNAGDQDGLARETMDRLVKFGFAEGERDNAPTKGDVPPVQIWTTEPDSPAVALLRSYLGKGVKVVDQESSEPGITIVVSDGFPGVVKGRRGRTAEEDVYVCSPPPVD